VAKQMFYTRDNQAQVDRLAQLLDEKKFRDVCRRIKERGMRTGFACLFYGAPGTGKTETVLQLAQQMKRDVMVVDFSQIRSKWVGDSEKNIKGVFERYRHFCKQLRRKPILLFNEADAVINTRQEQATRSVDKMENTMQNIILQEMEQFDGIMIATTNLAQNMDPAFERRFLYKIMFERPDASVRANLWQEMIPELDNEECQTLGEQFDFSGGQIENVARKYAISSILNVIEPSKRLTELTALCREECINDTKATRTHVGFVA
jgi:SpoVK/Ycf46/Vps4 family AAA+-type ATPase